MLRSELIGPIGRIADIKAQPGEDSRNTRALDEQQFNTIGERRPLDIGKVEIGGLPNGRAGDIARTRIGARAALTRFRLFAGLKIEGRAHHAIGCAALDRRRFLIGIALTRIDTDRENGTGQPLLHRCAHALRRYGTQALQPGLEIGRVPRIEFPRCQDAGLAGEAADAIQPGDLPGNLAHRHAIDFILGRSILDKVSDQRIETRRHGIRIGGRRDIDDHAEHAEIFKFLERSGNRGRRLLIANQDIVKTRACEAAKNAGRHIEITGDRRIQARHNPAAIEPRRGDAILHADVAPLIERRHAWINLFGLGSPRNIPEIALDQRARGGRINIAGQDEHRVIRAIMAAEPGANIIHGRRVEIRHRTDRGMPIGVAFRKQAFKLGIAHQAIRLVIPLPLFILDNAALIIELLLRHGTQ